MTNKTVVDDTPLSMNMKRDGRGPAGAGRNRRRAAPRPAERAWTGQTVGQLAEASTTPQAQAVRAAEDERRAAAGEITE